MILNCGNFLIFFGVSALLIFGGGNHGTWFEKIVKKNFCGDIDKNIFPFLSLSSKMIHLLTKRYKHLANITWLRFLRGQVRYYDFIKYLAHF